MNIITQPQTGSKSLTIVSLEYLIPQHDCLKLLILHTPYTLRINTLDLCINLVKLDLSKNNLYEFPYLGHLTSLRFMFLHENKLNLLTLKHIFEQDDQYYLSYLARKIVWITFWGNHNSFLARHYLANRTYTLAVDRNMIAPYYRCQSITNPYENDKNIEIFDTITQIGHLLDKKDIMGKMTSEYEYMKYLWKDMHELRNKHVQLYPIIKVQSVFRGWLQRIKISRRKYYKQIRMQLEYTYFKVWKQYTNQHKKLRKLLASIGKSHMLLPAKQWQQRNIYIKLIAWAKRAKYAVQNRLYKLKHYLRIYNLVSSHQLLLRDIYNNMDLQYSSHLFLHQYSLYPFQKYILSFLKTLKLQVYVQPNKNMLLRYLFDFHSPGCKEAIKILQTSLRSNMTMLPSTYKSTQGKKYKLKYRLCQSALKPIYRNLHFSTLERYTMKDILHQLSTRYKYVLYYTFVIKGDHSSLKAIVRGAYFYNLGMFTPYIPSLRIHLISYSHSRLASSIITIQRFWRGYLFRKTHNKHLQTCLLTQRAVILIQRWYRHLPLRNRYSFLYKCSHSLKKIINKCFYIELSEYFNIVMMNIYHEKNKIPIKGLFIYQYVIPYLDRHKNCLSLFWDNRSHNSIIINNKNINKQLFSSLLLMRMLGYNTTQLKQSFNYNSNSHYPCYFAHLFHFATDTTIVYRAGKKYLEIISKDKLDAKFRVFAILLITWQKKSANLVIHGYEDGFDNYYLLKKVHLCQNYSVFLMNLDHRKIQNCQMRLQSKHQYCFTVTNRMYLSKRYNKPTRLYNKLAVIMVNYPKSEPPIYQLANPIETIKDQYYPVHKRIKTYNNICFDDYKLLQRSYPYLISNDRPNLLPNNLYKAIRSKKYLKKFKIYKRHKQKPQPSFMLDSMSVNERLTTQPDHNDFISYYNPIIDNYYKNKKDLYTRQKMYQARRKETETSTNKFVNLCNFIQNQYLSENRRRIKTEIENVALETANKVRQSEYRSIVRRLKTQSYKRAHARYLHSLHKYRVERSYVIRIDTWNNMKLQFLHEKYKYDHNKAKLKKLRVSFAEYCYPLASNSKIKF